MKSYRTSTIAGFFVLLIFVFSMAYAQLPNKQLPKIQENKDILRNREILKDRDILKDREVLEQLKPLRRRDCVAYDPGELRIVDEGPRGWVLQEGRHRVALLSTRRDARRAFSVAARHTHHCFIGRGNKRPNKKRYIMEYWTGSSDLVTLAWPEDCVEYDPHQLRIQNRGKRGWLLTDGRTRLQYLDNKSDAEQALTIAKTHTRKCFIGRDNKRSNREDYILEYWKGAPSSLEQCIEYDPSRLRVENRGSAGWWVTDGDQRVAMLDNESDARTVLKWARRHSATCFIGKGNKRPNPQRYVVQYWTGMELGKGGGEIPRDHGETEFRKFQFVMADIPRFPWPPPQASAFASIPDEMVRNPQGDQTLLSDVDRRLQQALEANGYSEKSYYRVPEGFAMVTRLEQIRSDGTPREEPERWSTEVGPLRSFDLMKYLKALFTSNPGYYRVIVFVVTSESFGMSEEEASQEEALGWLQSGLLQLPDVIGNRPYTPSHRVTALIYEFEQPGSERKPKTLIPGRHTGTEHLKKANLLQSLDRD